MRKRIFPVLALTAVILSALILQGCSKQTSSPYGQKRLHPETLKILNDPLYQNVILPEDLAKLLEEKKEVYVYFFSPACPHCKETTPVLMPLAKELGIDLKLYNVLEFEQGWQDYKIEGTPTVVHFVDGQEKNRVVGNVGETLFREWFDGEKGGKS